MSLWDWAEAAWARPGVAAACIALQDEHEQCAPLLLWGLWWCDQGRRLDQDSIEHAVAASRSALATIASFRAERRGSSPPDREPLLKREVEAERRLLEQLEELPVPIADASRFPRDEGERRCVLLAISAAWDPPLPGDALDSLLRALASPESANVR